MRESARIRRALPRWSVRSRILASILLVTAIGMTVAGATAYLLQRERALAEIDDRLLSRVESARFVVTGDAPVTDSEGTVAATADDVQYASTTEALRGVLARVTPRLNESSLGIIDGVPAIIPGFPLDFHLEDDPEFIERVVDETSDGSVRIGTALSAIGHLRYVATPIALEGDTETAIYVTAVDLDVELQQLNTGFATYAAVATAALIAIGSVGWFVAGRLLRPIRQLRAAASRITVNQLHERIAVHGRDDVSDLAVTVNDMLERLDTAVTSQRQLLDDVRHELKTPITIVRGHLELVDSANVADVEATRALALDELDRMTRLVDDIESLAETATAAPARIQTDVADLTTEVFAKASVLPDHRWVLSAIAHRTMPLDPWRITQAWLQLVDNAAKYSPEGTVIEIGSTEVDSAVEFWVSDSGPGIPRGSEERIFERFGRVDASRGIRGSGLGLPIVKAIAASHGGDVSLATTSTGSRFAIVIPIDDSDPPPEIETENRDQP
ncbi:sensor histidine kinase [Marisediminicola senii]|uniref:sensor histidine kinase n=1 Tax=Marisediminicola senii TaxID=2711233 RepID=UPI0013EDEF07|nr:HAMP domain-containing sensor histidine kinase [Marisediminicola senii]